MCALEHQQLGFDHAPAYAEAGIEPGGFYWRKFPARLRRLTGLDERLDAAQLKVLLVRRLRGTRQALVFARGQHVLAAALGLFRDRGADRRLARRREGFAGVEQQHPKQGGPYASGGDKKG